MIQGTAVAQIRAELAGAGRLSVLAVPLQRRLGLPGTLSQGPPDAAALYGRSQSVNGLPAVNSGIG